MARHTHAWQPSYERDGSTYRECSDPDCHAHQQWICALDRWSEPFETPSPREREQRRRAALEAPASRES